jgi:hypothetical protein
MDYTKYKKLSDYINEVSFKSLQHLVAYKRLNKRPTNFFPQNLMHLQ